MMARRPRVPRLLASCVWLAAATGRLAGAEAPAPPAALSKELEACLALPDERMDLGRTALLIAKEERKDLDVAAEVKKLDALAARLGEMLTKAGTVEGKLDALRRLLFEEEKYGLPEKDDAAAFLLSDVLHNKRGNCLGLSLLCLALAERTGFKLRGVPVPSRLSGPGHLLVRYDDGERRSNFDPTQQGAARPDEYYRELFKLKPEDLKEGYLLGTATSRDVANLLLVNLGGTRVEAGRAAEAIPLLARAAALKPRYAPVYVNLGAARLRLREIAGAERDYKKALELDPHLVAARLGLAEVALRRGKPDEAESQAMTAEALEPENLAAKMLLANVCLARHQYRAACLLLNEVIRAAPKDTLARCNLGTAHRQAGEFAEAEQAFRAALEIDPHNADALSGLAETLRATGQAAQADAAQAEALKADPNHPATRLAQAQAARQAGDLRAAQTAYEAVLKGQPGHFEALGGLVEVLIAQGQVAAAEKRLAEAKELFPDHPAIPGLLSDLKMRTGDFRAALTVLREALRAPGEPDALLLQRLAICQGRLGEHAQARETAEQVLKRIPSDLTALRVAAAASENLRDRNAAIGYWRKIRDLMPEDPAAPKALARLGDK
jgi:tetratricopeptide (TPR) repeat protein